MAANTHSLSLTAASSQFAYKSDETNLQFGSGDFTVCAWIKRASTGNNRPIFAKTNGTTEGIAIYFRNENEIRVDLFNSGTDTIIGSTAITSTSTWYHVAVTRSGTDVKIYIDGVQDGTGTSSKSVSASTQDMLIGKMITDASYYFDGLIDEVRIYKGTALSSTEINNIKYKKSLAPANLVAFYKLNNSYGDASGNSYTLTSSGSPTFSTTVPFSKYKGTGLIGILN